MQIEKIVTQATMFSLLIASIFSSACMAPQSLEQEREATANAHPTCGIPLSGVIPNVTLQGPAENLTLKLKVNACGTYSKWQVSSQYPNTDSQDFIGVQIQDTTGSTDPLRQFYITCGIYPGQNSCVGDGSTGGEFILVDGSWQLASSVTIEKGDKLQVNFSTGANVLPGETINLGNVSWSLQ